jgi:hypothetical protein
MAGQNLPLLARVTGQAPWQVEAAILELEHRGAVTRHDDGRVTPRWPVRAASLWTDQELRDAHRRVAAELAAGTGRRLFHLVAAGAVEGVADEALALSRRWLADARVAEASTVIVQALATVRHAPGRPGESALLDALLRCAVADHTAQAFAVWLYEHARSGVADGTGHKRRLLAEAAVHAARWRGTAALATPEQGDEELDAFRHATCALAARSCELADERQAVARLADWARSGRGAVAHWTANSCTGWLHYREARYADAASEHLRAAACDVPLHLQLPALLNAASVWMETRRRNEAARLARQALHLARTRRLTHCEARAEWLQPAIAYRDGAW